MGAANVVGAVEGTNTVVVGLVTAVDDVESEVIGATSGGLS